MHQKLIKAATADTRGLPVSDGDLEHLARETRCAAFACGSALVAATQKTNPKIFAALFLKEQKGIDPAGDRHCTSHPILHRTCTGMIKVYSGVWPVNLRMGRSAGIFRTCGMYSAMVTCMLEYHRSASAFPLRRYAKYHANMQVHAGLWMEFICIAHT